MSALFYAIFRKCVQNFSMDILNKLFFKLQSWFKSQVLKII